MKHDRAVDAGLANWMSRTDRFWILRRESWGFRKKNGLRSWNINRTARFTFLQSLADPDLTFPSNKPIRFFQ